jgi:DNA polymerase elongation subunit (family B)
MYKLSSENKTQELREACHDEFVYYGCIDTYLIYEIDKKKNFTPLIIMMAEKYGVLHSEVLGTVKPWSSYLANAAYAEKKIIEVPPKVEEEPTIKGGRVMAPTPGRYSWLCSVDVNSMYPLLAMVGFNMSPETFVPLQKAPSDLREYILRYFNDEDEDRVLTLDDKIWNNVSELLYTFE